MVFEAFFHCEFCLSTSDFFKKILSFYVIKLINLNHNSITMLSIFSHLCESFVGVKPFVLLFRYFYHLKQISDHHHVRI